MRLVTLILVGTLCSSCAAHPPAVPAPTQPSNREQAALTVHVWTRAGETTTENIFDVNLQSREVTDHSSRQTPDGEEPGWAKPNIAERTRNRPVYERIVENVKANPSPDDVLVTELRRIEDRKGAGYAPEDFIVASPDGKQAVIRSFGNRPLLVVDVATSKVHRLLDDAGDQTPPVAWSPDSRSLAFAAALSGPFYVYDAQRQASAVVTHGAPAWIKELSWSPDGTRIVAFGLTNRRMDKDPPALLAAGAGHPVFRNDAVLFVCGPDGGDAFSVSLKNGISEPSSPRVRIEWK